MVDDFWGPEQWEVFRLTMDRVFPGKPITDIARSDAVMHVLYDIEEKDLTWIPGTRHLRRGSRRRNDGPAARRARRRRGARSQTIGTVSWWPSTSIRMSVTPGSTPIRPMYPEPMTALAYRYGLNYLVYAMTH